MKAQIFKSTLVLAVSLLSFSAVKAQDAYVNDKPVKEESSTIRIRFSSNNDTASSEFKPKFVGGISFTRFDLGFTKLVDNGSYDLSATNNFLKYQGGKSSHLSFDVVDFGYRFSQNFKVYVAGGFDWTLIRLKNNITMDKNSPTLSYTQETIDFKKNRFSSSYLHVPLNFEFRTNKDKKGNRFYFVVGPEVAFLLNGKVKQVSNEHGKVKFKDDYNFSTLRYGASARIGWKDVAAFVKVYNSDMFNTDAQKGLKNMAFGLTFGIN
ncbi:MAG: PorT family protein [Pedobacter sp.]|nr:MAG: PorT family protein [Pedobacter sp.]